MSNSTTAAKKGNGCGHDPAAPRFFSPDDNPRTSGHRNRPAIIKRLTKAVEEYYDSPEILPALNAANGSKKKHRREGRESCCAILGAMFHYLDIVTLRVGIPCADGSMMGLPMDSKDLDEDRRVVGLAEMAGLSLSRAERAMKPLKAAGIVKVHPICEKIEEGVYKGLAAIRTISEDLFVALGLDRWLAHERRRAVERRNKKMEKKFRKARSNLKMALRGQHGPKPAPKATRNTNGLTPAQAFFFANVREFLNDEAKAGHNDTS